MADSNSPSIFNRDLAMDITDGDAELLREIIEVYLADMPQQLGRLEEAIRAGDSDQAQRSAHTIKGASSNIGAEQVTETAFRIEKASKAGEFPSANSILGELENQFQELRAELGSSETEDF